MKTYNVKLAFSKEQDKQALLEMLQLHLVIWNYQSEWLHSNRTLNKKLLHDETYYQCKKKFPTCLSQMIIRAQHDVVSSYRIARSNNMDWSEMKSPFRKKRLSIRLDKRLYRMSQASIRISTLSDRINCSFVLYPRIQEMFGKYPVHDPLIFERDGDFFLSISFGTPETEVAGSSVLGLDLGEKRFATTSEGLCLAGKDLAQYNRNKRYLTKILQKKKKSGSARKKLKKNRNRIANHSKYYIHNIANIILRTKSDVIVLEDLDRNNMIIQNKNSTYTRKYRNRKTTQYPWRKLRDYLIYKALLVCKRVATVNPYMTSQKDHRGLPNGERKGCRYYTSDGKVFDADWNAAINIAQKYASQLKLPVLFDIPLDGKLNYKGRLSQLFSEKKTQKPIVGDSSGSSGKLRGDS